MLNGDILEYRAKIALMDLGRNERVIKLGFITRSAGYGRVKRSRQSVTLGGGSVDTVLRVVIL